MAIQPINAGFQANSIEPKRQNSNYISVENPIEKKLDLKAVNVTPDYNVRVPMGYKSLGTEILPFDTKAYMYKLENGQRVVIIPKEGPTVVKSYVNVGSMNEPDNVRGISHFIEHNLFNGSEGLDAGEFFANVNKMGANTNASTGFAATDFYIQSNLLKKDDLETQIRIHASMLETPKFAENMLAKEKGPVTSEINMILDDPENVAVNNTLKLLYNINSTSKDIIGGTVDNINKLTRNDVVDYYKRNYYPANMTTVITGDVKPDEAIKLVSKYFRSPAINPPQRHYEKLTPVQKTVRNDLISDKTNSAILSIGFNGPKNNNTKDKILLDAFQFFLVGSSVARLNKSLEEIQTNAFISSDRISTRPEDNTVVLFSTSTSDSNIENAINKVFKEVSDLEKNPPTDKELDIVKKKLKLNLAQVFESSSTINSVVGSAMLDNDLKSVKEFESVIDNLSAGDIVNFAKNYFDLNKVAITVIHPETANLKSISQNYKRAHNIAFTGKMAELNHKEALDVSKIKQYTLPNNIHLTTNSIDKNLVAFDFNISANVPADVKPGVSNVLSVMLNKGSKFADEKNFFSNLESKGVQASFESDERNIHATSMFLPDDTKVAIKDVKEVILNPRFTQEDLDEAKHFLKEQISNVPKNSQEGLLKGMFKNQYYGTSCKDILDNVDKITISDVSSLYQYIMKNSQANVVVSAPFDKNTDLKSTVSEALCNDFSTFKPANIKLFQSYVPVDSKNIIVQTHNKSQAQVQMGYKFKTNDNLKDTVIFELLNTILGGTPSSRLFSDLREQQKLAYQVSSDVSYYDNSGVMSLFIKTTTDDVANGTQSYGNLQKSIEGFNKHIELLKSEKVSDEELENAKLTLKNRILNCSELTADKNVSILLGLKSLYGASYDNKILDVADSITADDIQNAANYIFVTNPTISIVATKNTIDHNMDFLKKNGTVE